MSSIARGKAKVIALIVTAIAAAAKILTAFSLYKSAPPPPEPAPKPTPPTAKPIPTPPPPPPGTGDPTTDPARTHTGGGV